MIIIESCIVTKNRFETNNQSFHRNVPNQWLITEQFSIIDLLLDSVDKISENGRNIYEWNQSNNQYSKLISIELSGMNHVAWHFEDLEYLNTINIQYSEILSNVTERGLVKLLPSELMDVRIGRSTFYHSKSFHYYFAFSMNRNHHFFQKVLHNRV